VHLSSSKAGVWGAWAAGKGGDALDLIAAIKCDGDKCRAIRWALEWLRIDPQDRAQLDRLRGAKHARASLREKSTNKEKRDAAFRLWLAARPLRPGDEAYDYLGGTRGIDFDALGWVPRALRYFNRLTEPETGEHFPALLAGVFDRRGGLLTVHRTWLQRQEDGRVLKAPVAAPKKVYGPYKGGLIPLSRGSSGRPWKDPAPDDTVGLTEGVENGLSYAVAVPEHRVAAAVSVGNLASLALHRRIRKVVIAADSDAPGSPADQALQRAAARFLAEGREVRIARCPPGVKDLNALLLRAG
jgi:Toprim domain